MKNTIHPKEMLNIDKSHPVPRKMPKEKKTNRATSKKKNASQLQLKKKIPF